MTKAILSAILFIACLAPIGCSGLLDDQCLRRPDSQECE